MEKTNTGMIDPTLKKYKMNKKEQERLYQQLMLILSLIEDRSLTEASMHCEDLIEKLKYNLI